MKLINIDRILLFREVDNDVFSQQKLHQIYRIEPDGAIYYFGIKPDTLQCFRQTGRAINDADDLAFYEDLLDSLIRSSSNEKTLNLGLEPPEAPDAFTFVNQHMDLVEALAIELNAYQERAMGHDKRFQIVVRYASEMNDRYPSNHWGQQPDAFRATFKMVREVFRRRAPRVLFAFSPTIRADLWGLVDPTIAPPAAYWPGDTLVDLVSCTWYVSAAEDFRYATDFFQDYFLSRITTLKPFGIDEMGGCSSAKKNNDAYLKRMFLEIEALQIRGVSFKYVALFLSDEYGIDATLDFLCTSPTPDSAPDDV